MKQKKSIRGFSLTELSASIAIIAVIAGSAISVAITSDDAAKKTQTISKLDAIEDALGAYLAIHKRLPCPAAPTWTAVGESFAVEANDGNDPLDCDGTGVLSTGTASPEIYHGTLPVSTLQLPSEYYIDGWGRPFSYVVYSAFTNSTATNTTPCDGTGGVASAANNCFLHNDGASIVVLDAAGQSRNSIDGDNAGLDDNSMGGALFFSHGPNGHGAFFANGVAGRYAANDGRLRSSGASSEYEWRNVHLTTDGTASSIDAGFVQRGFIKSEEVSGIVFDDIVRFMTRPQLVRKTGNALYQDECVVAQTIITSPGANDCTSAANEPMCETFANEINTLCLQ